MIESKFLINNVESDYSKKITDNEFIAQLKEANLEQNQEYSRLKYLLRELKIEKQKADFNGDIALSHNLAEKISEAEKQKQVFAIESDDKVRFDCEKCRDTGFNNGERCECFYKKLNDEAYKFLEVRNIALHRFEDDELSSKEGLGLIYSTAKRFIEKIEDTDKNLLIFGKRGTGKTFLAECISNAVNAKKLNAIMITSFDFNNIFLKGFRESLTEKLITNEILSSCDLLVIDDLGAEPILNKVTIENLTAIISQRLSYKKPFVITTNLELDEISDRYNERIFSRLCGKRIVKIAMNGDDLRRK